MAIRKKIKKVAKKALVEETKEKPKAEECICGAFRPAKGMCKNCGAQF